MGGTFVSQTDVSALVSPSISVPQLFTNRLITSSIEADQEILSFSCNTVFYLQGFSFYVWDTIDSSMVVFGEASLESPTGAKLYTCQLTSMGLGREQVSFSQPLIIQPNQLFRLVCTPSAPIYCQTWQANIVGATN